MRDEIGWGVTVVTLVTRCRYVHSARLPDIFTLRGRSVAGGLTFPGHQVADLVACTGGKIFSVFRRRARPFSGPGSTSAAQPMPTRSRKSMTSSPSRKRRGREDQECVGVLAASLNELSRAWDNRPDRDKRECTRHHGLACRARSARGLEAGGIGSCGGG